MLSHCGARLISTQNTSVQLARAAQEIKIPYIASGGIADGRGLAAALSYGASGVWVGTRFVASEEAGAPSIHKQQVVSAGYDDVVRTLI